MRNTCAKTIPDWLVSLPANKYTLQEISDITNQSKNNIYYRFLALDVSRKRICDKEKHLSYYIYEWLGAEYYVNKFLKERMKNK